MKYFLQAITTLFCLFLCWFFGWVFHTKILLSLKGVNHVTGGDVMTCYFLGIIVAGIIWLAAIIKIG